MLPPDPLHGGDKNSGQGLGGFGLLLLIVDVYIALRGSVSRFPRVLWA